MGEEKGSREIAVEILNRVEKTNAYADILLDRALRSAPLAARDRALLTQLVYGTLRWRGRIDWHLSRFLDRPLSRADSYLRNILRLTLYQLLFLEKIPDYAAVHEGVALAKRYGGRKAAGLINAVARRLLREKDRFKAPAPGEDPTSLSILFSHPEWLARRWVEHFGKEEASALMEANNREAPLTLRANRLRVVRDDLLQILRAQGLNAAPTARSPQGLQLKSASPVEQLPGFEEGLFQVQGEASQLISYLVDPRPGERLLDACAAPGGKATHLAELMEDRGEIVATDILAKGLEKLKENVQRLRLRSVRPIAADISREILGPAAGPYNRILVDAPCTALGTLRSHPEARWQKKEKDIDQLRQTQKRILARTARELKAGGVLVYATCTLTYEENEGVIQEFLNENKEFTLEEAKSYLPPEARDISRGSYLLALPHRHNTDGLFAVRMRKGA